MARRKTRLTIRIPSGIDLFVETQTGGKGEPTPGKECVPVVAVDPELVRPSDDPFHKLMLMPGPPGNYRWNAAGCKGGPNGFCRPGT